jgi:hypothetical protein
MAAAERVFETEVALPVVEYADVLTPRPSHKSLNNLTENMLMFCTLVFLGVVLACLHANILRAGYQVDGLEKESARIQKDIGRVHARIGQMTAAITVERLAVQQGWKRVEPHEIDDLTRPTHTWRRPVMQPTSAKKP